MSLSNDNPERKKRILQYANNVMHNEVAKGEIIVVARHSKQDPRKFTIVADSEYDRQLEGIDLIFNDADDFKRIFPDLAKPLPSVLAPGMEAGESNVAVPLHKDPYIIKNVVSSPEPENPDIDGPQNVLDDDETTQWAVNQSPATLLLDLGQDCEIGTLWIKWSQGHTRQFKFIIAVATENQISKKNGVELICDYSPSGREILIRNLQYAGALQPHKGPINTGCGPLYHDKGIRQHTKRQLGIHQPCAGHKSRVNKVT